MSEFETLADLKKDLGDKLKARREDAAQHAFRERPDRAGRRRTWRGRRHPDAMVDAEAEKLVNNYAQRVTSQGIPFDQYLAMMGMTMEQMKEQAKESALKQVQSDLALGAIVDAEKDRSHRRGGRGRIIKRLAEQYNMTEEQLKKVLIAETDLKRHGAVEKAARVVFDSAKTGKAPAKKKAAKKKADAEAEGEEKPKRTRKATKKDEEKSEEKSEEKTEG